ncbi:MAG: WecB/TagA/CpsF family glycosyltransferase [Alphaproteobacteria bacterium]
MGDDRGAAAAVAEDRFLGVPLARLDVPGAAATIAARDPASPFAYVVTPNAQHFVRLGRDRDALLGDAYDHAWLRLCDSQVVRGLARLLFGKHLPHAAGSDLTAYMLAATIRPDDPVTVIGGSEELARRLREKYRLTRLALHSPPMGLARNAAALDDCVRFVVANPGRYVFLAVGMPVSELLARRIQREGQATGVGLCVGSSLNFAVGIVNRAPPFFRRFGLEWLHRLAINPRGHAKRIFVESMPLLIMVARARIDPHAYDRQPSDTGHRS